MHRSGDSPKGAVLFLEKVSVNIYIYLSFVVNLSNVIKRGGYHLGNIMLK